MEFEYWEDVLDGGSDEEVSLQIEEEDDYVVSPRSYPVPSATEDRDRERYNPYLDDCAGGPSYNFGLDGYEDAAGLSYNPYPDEYAAGPSYNPYPDEHAGGPGYNSYLDQYAAGPSYNPFPDEHAGGPSYNSYPDQYAAGTSYNPYPDEYAAGPSYNPYPNEYAAGPSYNPYTDQYAAGPSNNPYPESYAAGPSDYPLPDEDEEDEWQYYNTFTEADGPSSVHSDDPIWETTAMLEVELELLRLSKDMRDYLAGLIDMPVIRRPQRTSALDGPSWVHWVLTNPNENTCWEQFRMLPHTFIALCNTLQRNGFLKSSRYVKITEQVAIFILTMAQNHSQRSTVDRLQRSTWTISTYLRRSCRALCKLGKTIIQPCPIEMPHPVVTGNRKYYPWFGSCIGAIDGTNISARVPRGNTTYRGRKSTNQQNVMCVVDFDMCFTYVYSGWEGSAHDSRIFTMCVNDEALRFPKPADGFFYVLDAGYDCARGFLPLYRRNRYHLQTFQETGPPTNVKELFNYRHSSLRGVVERTFGVLKNRFPIFNLMPPYPLRYQRLFVIACCTIHNFIRKSDGLRDKLFADALRKENFWIDVSERERGPTVNYVSPGERPDQSEEGRIFMRDYRDRMARHIWRHNGRRRH